MDFLEEARALEAETDELRRTIHRYPEVGNNEFHTAQLVEDTLNSLGIETVRLTDTAIMGTLKGACPGKTAALRADMDALPVFEETGCDFASQNEGIMHACGHDIHTTALLTAAKLLAAHKDELRGEVRFFFQPDEEGEGGSQRMIENGCMQGVDAVFGAHVSPEIPLGSIGIRYGKFYAAADKFDVVVHGKSAHGAEPEKGINALAAAALMVTELQKLPELTAPEKSVVTVGAFHSGKVRNIIADRAEFCGIIRTLGKDSRQKITKAAEDTILKIAAATGTSVELKMVEGYSGVVNTDTETDMLKASAEKVLGADKIITIEQPTMTTEDFGYFIDEAKGAFYHIGAGSSYPLHNSRFLPDIKAATIAAAVHAQAVYDFLNTEA